MTAAELPRRKKAMTQVLVSISLGVVAAVIAAVVGQIWYAPLLGWDVAALTYLTWTWRIIGHLDPTETADHATLEDPTRPQSDTVLLLASVASLVAVGFVLVHVGRSHGLAKGLTTTFGIGSIVVAWLVVHTTYTLRYARLYHDNQPGGVDFNQSEAPRYGDFAYIAFTIGMTFQVSDTSFTSSTMRATALRQALLSYLFGTVIIATAINIVAGLAK